MIRYSDNRTKAVLLRASWQMATFYVGNKQTFFANEKLGIAEAAFKRFVYENRRRMM